MANTIILTIDVEDWFQVENFKSVIPRSTWDSRELRVERNVHLLLDLLDSIDLNTVGQAEYWGNGAVPRRPRATFFVLGWIADRLPHLIREISGRGHEVASHGYGHTLCNDLSPEELLKDLTHSKMLIEDIIAAPVNGYRAPSFSISDDALESVRKCGYRYDSSYNAFSLNKRYGKLSNSRGVGHPGIVPVKAEFYELPLSNLMIGRHAVPFGGGGYFRLYPFLLLSAGIRAILKSQGFYVLYLHPWEVDPEQPRVPSAAPLYRFRHYVNLRGTLGKLRRLIERFSRCRFSTCSGYLFEPAPVEP